VVGGVEAAAVVAVEAVAAAAVEVVAAAVHRPAAAAAVHRPGARRTYRGCRLVVVEAATTAAAATALAVPRDRIFFVSFWLRLKRCASLGHLATSDRRHRDRGTRRVQPIQRVGKRVRPQRRHRLLHRLARARRAARDLR